MRACARLAPLAAQCIMLAVMLLQRQWLFAMMIGSGCVGLAAALLPAPAPGAPIASEHERRDDGEATHAARRAIVGDGLAHVLRMGDDPAPFRTIAHRWCRPERGCRARVGRDAAGAPLVIDLAAQGPHAIVAGTTGSGKSVLLQDWCVALASAYPPDMLQFVLLDFKGGSSMDRLTGLPHVRGCVNDLDLRYATRALLSLERELTRRERVAARLGVTDLMESHADEARLIIVVDEFHMLHGQLPDYIDRLVRVASLGRSLGMHLIACTQNPLGQISASMKANMSLRVCLRVRDPLQSQEMIGTDQAAHLSSACPGAAIMMADDERRTFRCADNRGVDALVEQIGLSARVHGLARPPALFTAPLPDVLAPEALPGGPVCEDGIAIGLSDDGVTLTACTLPLRAGAVAVVGQHGRGKSTLLRWVERVADDAGLPVRCVDDADELLDPLSSDPQGAAFRDGMRRSGELLVFALRSTRRLRVPEHCSMRILFPTGERAVDLADGVPPELLRAMGDEDFRLPGRAVIIDAGSARLVQLVLPQSHELRKNPGSIMENP